MNKIGVLYSGISFQHQTLNNPDFRGLFIPINVYDLPTIDLRLYDAIIVPRSVDQVALNDYKRVVREFLDLPGILVVLGDYRGDWLPGCRAGGFTPEDDDPLKKTADHPVLRDIESAHLHWHKGINGLCSHGHLLPPEGAAVLIRNSRGDTILYEDRVSTKGIILAGSQFDIFCHCFSNDEGALLALRNLVGWINEETPNIRAARKEKQIGVVYSGLHFHYDLFTRSEYGDMELIYIRRLGKTDLSRYNALIVPRESNQEVLFAEREKLVYFLERGGMVFTFGEVILPWLPGLSWKKVLPAVCLPEDANIRYKTGDVVTDNLVIEEEGHPLFEGITLDDLRWHYHGVFSPHPGQRVLLSDGRGNAVILLDEDSFTGKVVATTLDPEEHSGFGEVMITERFLGRCIEWIRRESAGIEVKV
jgi:hypothetical protein